jgi:hypothetical protein
MNPLALGDTAYAGPSLEQAITLGACWCNTVIYNLLSACSECQGKEALYWSVYQENCSTIMPPATFPNPVPEGTRVPRWVLLEIPSTNYWSPTAARYVGDIVEVFPGELIDTPVILPTTTSAPSYSFVPGHASLSLSPLPVPTQPSLTSSGVTLILTSFAGGVTTVAAIAGVILSLFS